MFTYCIAGVPKCPDFSHAKFIAEKLKLSLPRFSYKVIVKTEKEYQDWLQKFCLEQKWKIYQNPLIWKCINNSNSHCHLIGGINEFFEYLTEYYNINTRLDKRIKQQMALDNKERLSLMLSEHNILFPVHHDAPRKVCISGAVYPSTSYLVSELLQLKPLHTKGGVAIYLYHKNVNKYGDLIKIKNELSDPEFNARGQNALVVVNNVEAGLLNCDLLIVVGNEKRIENEDCDQWTNRNYTAMKTLASILNRHCPKYCKVMLMGMDNMLGFNLSVLAENANNVYLYNIVGVTGHHGMEWLPEISRVTGVPISRLHCPPVWGFVGWKIYFDLNHIIYHCADSRNKLSSLALNHGNKSNEQGDHGIGPGDFSNPAAKFNHKYLRTILMQSMTNFVNIVNSTSKNNECQANTAKTCPLQCLAEIRATITMISEWFENKSNKIISAAIFSDGTFGLPFGMFLSQPVYIENGEWKPDFNFPQPEKKILMDIVSKVSEILIEYNLGKRFSMNWREAMPCISE